MKKIIFTFIATGIILLLTVAAPVAAIVEGEGSISTISPHAGYPDQAVTVTITGSNFSVTQGDVRLEMAGESDIHASSISSWSNTQILCTFIIDDNAETGDWDLVVVRGYDDVEIVKDNGFTIVEPMTLTSISPTSAQAGDDDVDFTIVGKKLSNVDDVYLFNDVNDDKIYAEDFDVVSSIKITGTFNLEDEDEETYEVCVEDTNGAVKCDLTFDITTNKVGSIEISSSPSGAAIFLDGIANGTTPNTVDDILEGSYRLVLKKNGYEDWGKIVKVVADDTIEVDAKLYAVATATANAGTPVPTTVRTTVRTTKPSTIKVPTTWPSATPTEASPVEPVLVIAAAGIAIGLLVMQRRS